MPDLRYLLSVVDVVASVVVVVVLVELGVIILISKTIYVIIMYSVIHSFMY